MANKITENATLVKKRENLFETFSYTVMEKLQSFQPPTIPIRFMSL